MSEQDDNFRANLTKLRQVRGIDRNDFSDQLTHFGVDLSPALLYRTEVGLRKIVFGEAWGISKLFGIPMEVMAEAHADDDFDWMAGEEPAPKFTRPKQTEILADAVLGEVRARVMELISRGDY